MDSRDRRRFLGVCLGGLLTAAAAAISYPLYLFLAPRRTAALSEKVVLAEIDLPEGGAKFFEFAGSAAVLIRKRGGEIVAFSAVCTHLGCIVQWEKDKQGFLCPCHAGHYDANGAVTSGPPPKPLTRLPFMVANGKITVG